MSREQLQTGSMNNGIREFWMPNWIRNASKNRPMIEHMFHERGMGLDLLHGPKAPPPGPNGEKTPLIILGSGPSLERAIPYLRFWRGAIMGSPSQVKLFGAMRDREMDFILALDTTTRVIDQFGTVDVIGSNLFTHPSMCPELFHRWKNKQNIYLFRMFEPENEVLNTLYDALFPFIRGRVINSGCIANNAIIIANNMGFGPIFLVGVDFGYPKCTDIWDPEHLYQLKKNSYMQGGVSVLDWMEFEARYKKDPDIAYEIKGYFKDVGHLEQGILRFRDYVDIGDRVYEPEELQFTDKVIDPTLKTSDNGIWTTDTNIFYKQTLLANYKLLHPQIVNCSKGLLNDTKIPQMDIEDVVERQGANIAWKEGDSHYMTWPEIDKASDEYLIPRGIFAKYGFDPRLGPEPVIRGIEIIDSLQREQEQAHQKADVMDRLAGKWTEKKDGTWSRRIDPEDKPDWVPPELMTPPPLSIVPNTPKDIPSQTTAEGVGLNIPVKEEE